VLNICWCWTLLLESILIVGIPTSIASLLRQARSWRAHIHGILKRSASAISSCPGSWGPIYDPPIRQDMSKCAVLPKLTATLYAVSERVGTRVWKFYLCKVLARCVLRYRVHVVRELTSCASLACAIGIEFAGDMRSACRALSASQDCSKQGPRLLFALGGLRAPAKPTVLPVSLPSIGNAPLPFRLCRPLDSGIPFVLVGPFLKSREDLLCACVSAPGEYGRVKGSILNR